MKKESKIFSINWGNMPGHSWEKTTESTVLFLQSLSWLMLHFHGHMLLSSSLVPKFQNLCFPASQLVIWRAGKRKSRGTSTASQHQGWLLHDQREWNEERWEIFFPLISGINSFITFNSLPILLHVDHLRSLKMYVIGRQRHSVQHANLSPVTYGTNSAVSWVDGHGKFHRHQHKQDTVV